MPRRQRNSTGAMLVRTDSCHFSLSETVSLGDDPERKNTVGVADVLQ